MWKLIAIGIVVALAALLAHIAGPAVAGPAQVACRVSSTGPDVSVNCTEPVPHQVEVEGPGRDGKITATVTF